jgi:hypothetical protein
MLQHGRTLTWLPLLAALLTAGCTEVTWWDARGDWTGRATLPGGVSTQRSSSVSDPEAGPTEDEIELCESNEMVLGFSFLPFVAGNPAAIEVRTARSLCQEGHTQITGGTVLVWRDQGGSVTAAERSDDWTVTGEINVTDYLTQGLPDLDPDETAETDHIEGTISLTATDGAGNVIRIEDGAFELTVVASRVKLSIS